jgi:vacuolar protein sorting-associated protein 18
MALEASTKYAATLNPTEPIFSVQRVQLQFSVAADFVAAQVSNDVLVVALSTGRILRIDLDSPEDIDGMRLALYPRTPNHYIR